MSAALILKLVRPDLEDLASKFEFVLNYFKVCLSKLFRCFSKDNLINVLLSKGVGWK